jgi:NADP-reducing hydrogenase subunit HndD
MFGAIAKTYYADLLGIPREKMVVVSVMPCLAKKYECERPEFKVNGNPDVDYSITTRELARLIKRMNIDFAALPDEDFDKPLGESSGAAPIFGATGGVIEAALRTAYELATGQTLENVNFEAVRGMQGIRSAKVQVGPHTLNIGIAHELGNARKLLKKFGPASPSTMQSKSCLAPAAVSAVVDSRITMGMSIFSSREPRFSRRGRRQENP